MTFLRDLFNHAVRYRRVRTFTALGGRRRAAASTYLRHAIRDLAGAAAAPGAGWDDVAGFKMRHMGESWMVYLYGEVFAQREYWFSCGHARPVILDCGGNIGMSTLFFKALYPDAQIAVFEPAPWACEAIEATLRANELTGVMVHNVALAAAPGSIELFHDSSDPGSALMSVHALPMLSASTRVPAARLSSFVTGPVDYMKLDVVGSEMIVLREMAAAGALSHVRQIGMEYHHHLRPDDDALGECLTLLEAHGFGYQITGRVYTPVTPGQFQGLMIHAYRKGVME